MKPTEAFDVCHDIYLAARESVDARLPTMQLDSASKFLWRPNVRPRLIEYVADFALAGERALAPDDPAKSFSRSAHNGRGCELSCSHPKAGKDLGTAATRRHVVSIDEGPSHWACGEREPRRASRLILFRMYYLGGAEYQAARRLLGIGELTWTAWTDEIRTCVGRELLRRGIFPPSRYFRQPA